MWLILLTQCLTSCETISGHRWRSIWILEEVVRLVCCVYRLLVQYVYRLGLNARRPLRYFCKNTLSWARLTTLFT